MMPEQKLSSALLFIFVFFCLNLSHAQTSPQFPAIPINPNIQGDTLPTTSANPATAQPVSLDSTGKPIKVAGKYAEYQSMCRENEYDTTAYFSDELKKRRADLLKEKTAAAGEYSMKLKLRLLKEYIDQDEPKSAKALADSLKKQKLSSFENVILNALIAISVENYNYSVSILLRQLSEDNKNSEVLLLLAEVYKKLENYYEASTIYEDLNKTTGNSYLPQLCEAMVLNSVNAEAEKVCQLAIDKFPENPFPMIFKGISLREREDAKMALSSFKKSINIKPTEMGYLCLAEAFFMKDDLTSAIEQFKNASNISPNSVRAILGLAWALLKQKHYAESLQSFKKACALNGKYETEIRKAAKILLEDKISAAKLFVSAAEACGG